MNPIAQQALNRALRFPVSAIPPVARQEPAQRLVQQTTQQPAPVEPKKIALPGKPERPKHLDQWGFRQGQKDAADLVLSMTATLKMHGGKQQVINQLKQAASIRPASQALGVWRVIDLLEAQV